MRCQVVQMVRALKATFLVEKEQHGVRQVRLPGTQFHAFRT